MYMYISAYSKEELARLSKDDFVYVIGIIFKDVIIKPPRCKICGGFLLEDSLYGQCTDCGRFYKLYLSNNLKDWHEDESCL